MERSSVNLLELLVSKTVFVPGLCQILEESEEMTNIKLSSEGPPTLSKKGMGVGAWSLSSSSNESQFDL